MFKKRKTQPSTQLQSLLPDDIFLEILERLPVHSLLRFTSVSKSWEASIKNPSFISSNHRHLCKSRSGSHLLFMPDPTWYSSELTCSLIPEYCTIGPNLNYNPVLNFGERAMVVGSSEGLICFKTTSALYLWNPFIRKSLKKVRAGKISLSTNYMIDKPLSIELGFGFAPKSRDHRIVKLLFYDNYLCEVEIYSLTSDSWRRIEPRYENRKKVKFLNTYAVYLEGCIYWLVALNDGDGIYNVYNDMMILRFDLEEEKFEEIAGPRRLKSNINIEEYKLVVIQEFLVIWRVRPNSNEIKMRAYISRKSNSGSSSWAAKTISIPGDHYGETIISWNETTMGGQIIVGVLPCEHKSVLVYNADCDGKNLGFEWMYMRIIDTETRHYNIVPVTQTLFLFDEK